MAKTFKMRGAGVGFDATFYTNEVLEQTRKAMLRNVASATNYLANKVRKNISQPRGKKRRAETVSSEKEEESLRRAIAGLISGGVSENASGPWLKVVSMRLKNSILPKINKDAEQPTGEVGTNVLYGVYWELAGRSFLVRTLFQERDEITKRLTRKA